MSANTQRWVVKVGSGLVTANGSGIDEEWLAKLAGQITRLTHQGIQTMIVSSGAISAGMSVLKFDQRPRDLHALQGCASIGQPKLMRAYERAFMDHGLITAQILLTYWDLDSRKLYANTKATLEYLLSLGSCVPIFNENDALSFEEIEMLNRFGDNDTLSGLVAILSQATQLVILSGIEGLYTNTDGTGDLVHHVPEIDAKIESYAGQTQSQHSVGGMISKLNTAKTMLKEGIPMVIASGKAENILIRLANGERLGTRFCP